MRRQSPSGGTVKPTDEEPFAPNNPKGFVGKAPGQPGLKRSVRRQGSGKWQHTFLTMITLLMCPYCTCEDHSLNLQCQ